MLKLNPGNAEMLEREFLARIGITSDQGRARYKLESIRAAAAEALASLSAGDYGQVQVVLSQIFRHVKTAKSCIKRECQE